MRHVLVTGAANGIGRSIATRFARDGAFVTMVDRPTSALADAAADIGSETGTAHTRTIGVDLTDAAACTRTVDGVFTDRAIDVLVNCAGIYPATPFLDLDADTWDSVQALNVRAPMLTTVALARNAVAASTHASIVNISSGAALRARPGAAPYCSSKAALEMLTRASALELGPHGIRVNAVAPGFVAVASDVNPVSGRYADAVSRNPLGRSGTPEDIAHAVVWISGQHAEWITGEVLRVDGGASTGAVDLPLHWN
ncbi:short-chain dehydrogenase [Rhodococcus sp. 05-2255-3B1]|uniref:SDR family NAD(P)-dependent oxidoreductase n=1 Tax=unclassified Rhodococcus (in: high G+C Gram-positive bacteria) TaxID=192944 RepID=UPI000B9BD3E8|nr:MULTISPECIES: SDR family oxidoreductase [unclassified Rhodococcus (in: high G+C Gram-positive bacteria)]OZE03330.1 short-chain dehydrogenase [Rhodococcus sp. 05-2255-3C]OZE09717.1 short-chain dehydrogenase [Rhodococcus sp. 05-2255-3B1]OZE14984.1 short-chain dehydrogenase [Rhodococcus sp. 05-2255-2A2]